MVVQTPAARAAFVARNEDIPLRLEAHDLCAKIVVGFLAVDRLGLGEALVPHQLRIGPFIDVQSNQPFLRSLIVLRAVQTP
jgi:hypothetical protein